MSRDTDGKRPKKGYKMSAEAVEKRNASRRKNNPNWFRPETIEKLREAQTGMRYNKQAKQNMSDAAYLRETRKGKKRVSLETRAKISYQRAKRPPPSAEQKEKQSYKMKLYWEKRKKAEAEGKVQ